MKRPTREEISEYQRRTIRKRWDAQRERVARGEILPVVTNFRPRGPMPDNIRVVKHLSILEHEIRRAKLVNAALRGDKLTRKEINALVKKKDGKRRYIAFGGKRPQRYRLHYSALTKRCLEQFKEEFGL